MIRQPQQKEANDGEDSNNIPNHFQTRVMCEKKKTRNFDHGGKMDKGSVYQQMTWKN